MIRPTVIAAAIVLAVMVTGLFELKYEVRELDQEKSRLHDRIAEERESLRVLQAEWSYLNHPDRIQALVAQHLALTTPSSRQILPVEQIPMRPRSDTLAQAAAEEGRAR